VGNTGVLDAVTPFALQEFELVEASPEMALLRVSARAANGFASSEPPTMLVDTGSEVRRLKPLPGPAAGEGSVRAGYSAPASLVGNAKALFALELPHGVRVDLPPPRRRNLGAAKNGAQPGAESERITPQHQASQQALMDLQLKLRAAKEWRAEIEQRIAALIDERTKLRATLDGKDESLAALAATISERDAELAELRESLQRAERTLEDHRARAEALAIAYREKSHELEAGLERERAAIARAAEADGRAAKLCYELDEARSQTASLEARVAEAHAEISRLRDELDRSVSMRAQVESAAMSNAEHAHELCAQISRLNGELTALGASREELSDRIRQLIGALAVTGAAREEAEQAAAHSRREQAGAAASIAELEQRIESLSDEVSTVRAQLDQARASRDEARADALTAREHAASAERAAEQARTELTAALSDAQIDRDALVLAKEDAETARIEAAEVRAALEHTSSASASERQRRAPGQIGVAALELTGDAAGQPPDAQRRVRSGSASSRNRGREAALITRLMPPEAVLGMCMLVLGVTVAILFLTGAVRVGVAP